jgi:hypothetical protein
MIFPILTNWSVGIINGYLNKNEALPSSIKYGTLLLTTFAGILKGTTNLSIASSYSTRAQVIGLFFGVPLFYITTFYCGHQFGKAIHYLEDSRSNK